MKQLENEKHSRIRFWILLALLLGLCIVRYAFRVNLPRVVLLAVAITIAIVGNRDEIIAMCICCIPLHESIDFFYTIVLCVGIYAVRFPRHVRIGASIVPILLIFVWELLHCLGEKFSVVELVSNLTPFLPLLLLLCTDCDEHDYDYIVRALAVATAAISLALLVKVIYAADFNLLMAFANLQRLGVDTEETKKGTEILGSQINPNSLGVICVLAMTGLMQLRQAGRKKWSDMPMVLFLLVFGTLTSSRTYLACLAMMAVLLLISQKGSLAHKLKFLGAILIVTAIALAVLYLIFPTLMGYYAGRFQEKDLTTGRLDLMVKYHDFIMSNPKVMFFGVGLQDFLKKVLVIFRVAVHVPHNGIQEVIVAWGLPGLLLFVALWGAMILRSRKCCKKQGLINYIPLLVILLKAQAGQMLDSPYTMLAFSFAYLSMCANLITPEPEALEEPQ